MLQRYGRYANGRQRWFCPSCRHSFSRRNPAARRTREREWFRRWIVEGYSVRQLSLQSGHSRRRLSRLIGDCLVHAPTTPARDLGAFRHVVLDGTFLRGRQSVVVLMDGQTHTVIHGQYGISERSEPQLRSLLAPLVEQGLSPSSFTVDGSPKVIKVVSSLWPETVIQRCLVHIQRQGMSWCRLNPKTEHARHLRDIFLQVTGIRTATERDDFLRLVSAWEDTYGELVQARAWRGRVIRDVKQARSMLLRALPNMFHHIADPGIPISTNGIEGYFSRLKARYRQHRGLSVERRHSYFAWYLHLVTR